MKLYIIRHGQTEWNIKYKLQGKTDIPLNEEGRRQAEEAREIFNDIDIDLIICSTLDRAKETCRIINKDKNIPVIYDERICERNHGVLEGVDARTIDFDELINYYTDKKIENGESIQEFYNRIYNFLDELEQKYKNDERILLVAHGDVSRAVYCYFNGIPENGNTKDLMINNCEIKKYEK